MKKFSVKSDIYSRFQKSLALVLGEYYKQTISHSIKKGLRHRKKLSIRKIDM